MAAPEPRGARRPESPGQARRGECGRRGRRPRGCRRCAPRRVRPGTDQGGAPGQPRTFGPTQPKSQPRGHLGPGFRRGPAGEPATGRQAAAGSSTERAGGCQLGLGHHRRPDHHVGQRQPFGQPWQPRAVRRRIHRHPGFAEHPTASRGFLLAAEEHAGIRVGRRRLHAGPATTRRTAQPTGQRLGGRELRRAPDWRRQRRCQRPARGTAPSPNGCRGIRPTA